MKKKACQKKVCQHVRKKVSCYGNTHKFARCSGCKVNLSKSEAIWIGSKKGSNFFPFSNHGLVWKTSQFKALGAYLGGCIACACTPGGHKGAPKSDQKGRQKEEEEKKRKERKGKKKKREGERGKKKKRERKRRRKREKGT